MFSFYVYLCEPHQISIALYQTIKFSLFWYANKAPWRLNAIYQKSPGGSQVPLSKEVERDTDHHAVCFTQAIQKVFKSLKPSATPSVPDLCCSGALPLSEKSAFCGPRSFVLQNARKVCRSLYTDTETWLSKVKPPLDMSVIQTFHDCLNQWSSSYIGSDTTPRFMCVS